MAARRTEAARRPTWPAPAWSAAAWSATIAALALATACRSPAAPAPDGNRWTTLAPIAGATDVPEDWTIADPFGDRTPYHPTASFMGVGTAPLARGTTRALVRSPQGLASQIFVVRDGDYERWRTRIHDRMGVGDPLLRVEDEGVVHTRDGVGVAYLVIRQSPGVLAGEDLTYFLGHTEPPDPFLVVDAGGPTGRFDPEVARRFVATLALDGRALAYRETDAATARLGEPAPRPSFRIVPGEAPRLSAR
jgi:hypothetical protein